MKYIVVLIINLFFIQTSYSQIHEFGVFFGGSNIIGDIEEPSFVKPTRLAFGAVYKWNRSSRHSWRISGSTNYKMADVGEGSGITIGDVSAGIEFNFFEFDLHKLGKQQTPYVFTGISGVLYEPQEEFKFTPAIPIILGYKYRLSQSFIIAAEIGARYTFTDNLDGSNYIADDGTDYSFGNLNNNDWYVFTGFTLTYTFGRNPCYCIN